MSKPTYWEMLRDPRWQEKRLRIMGRAGFTCEECGDKTTTLNVHHRYYAKGRKPWEYEDESLACLCEPCHKATTDMVAEIARGVGSLTPNEMEEVLGYVQFHTLLLRDDSPDSIKIISLDHAIGVARAAGIIGRVGIDLVMSIADNNGGFIQLVDLIGISVQQVRLITAAAEGAE